MADSNPEPEEDSLKLVERFGESCNIDNARLLHPDSPFHADVLKFVNEACSALNTPIPLCVTGSSQKTLALATLSEDGRGWVFINEKVFDLVEEKKIDTDDLATLIGHEVKHLVQYRGRGKESEHARLESAMGNKMLSARIALAGAVTSVVVAIASNCGTLGADMQKWALETLIGGIGGTAASVLMKEAAERDAKKLEQLYRQDEFDADEFGTIFSGKTEIEPFMKALVNLSISIPKNGAVLTAVSPGWLSSLNSRIPPKIISLMNPHMPPEIIKHPTIRERQAAINSIEIVLNTSRKGLDTNMQMQMQMLNNSRES
jgi:hypothetical protein